MEVCTFVLTFMSLIPELGGLLSIFLNAGGHRGSGSGEMLFLPGFGVGLGRSPWMRCQGNTLLSPWENLGFFWGQMYVIWAVQCPATFQRLMHNCLGEMNLKYCLIYLDDVIVFTKMQEEHSKCLCFVFDHFQEHSLRLGPTKCKFFWDKITYLAHHVSKGGMQPNRGNLKAVAEFVPLWT